MPTDIDTLMEMGFPQNRAEKALAKTQYKGVQNAMEWLFAHSEDPDIDDPYEAPKGHLLSETTENAEASNAGDASQPMDESSAAAANSLKCDDCGKLLKTPEAAELHAARTQHTNFSESTEEIKPLTAEEKQKQLELLQEKRIHKRVEKEQQEKEERIAREKLRRVHGKEMAVAKQKHEELEMKKLLEQRKREKEEEKLAKQRVRDQIEKDKRDRAAKAAKQQSPAEAPASSPTPAKPQEKKDYDQARIQIRLTNGQALTHEFGAKEPLSAVRLYTQMNRSDGEEPITFMTTFPRKVYTEADMDAPLSSLGLVPSAVLIVTKK